ncbi:MAG: type II secretion system F family protein, partial [Desulfuromonadales bacterium]
MALYSCKIGASDGKILNRDFEAADSGVLRKNLEDQGFFVFNVKKKPFQFLFDKGVRRKKIDNKALLTFNQEMLVLIKAGMPIMQVLDAILERHDSGALYEVLVQVR